MPPESSTILFRSDLFQVDPREDEETNPFCYGRELAEWVHIKFQALGYEAEPVIAEDWGWCVMLAPQGVRAGAPCAGGGMGEGLMRVPE
jgi:hypothetical protein